jgi:hypothetical protein
MKEEREYMRNFLIFAILVLGFILSIDGNAQFFWGNVNSKDAAVNLTNQIAHQNDTKTIEVGSLDPLITPIDAATGSLYINSTGLFQKADIGSSTNWIAFLTSPVDLTADVSGVLPVANGGTNSSTALDNGKVMISDGGAIREASAFLYDDATNIATMQNASIGTATATILNSTDATFTNAIITTATATTASITDLFATNATLTTATATTLGVTDLTATNAIITTATATTASIDALTVPLLDASRALITDANKLVQSSVTTSTEISYVNGVTSAIQTQLDSKIPLVLATGYIYVGNDDQLATGVPVSGDVTLASSGDVQIVAGSIVNADVSASAAIDFSKMALLTGNSIPITDATGTITTSADLTHVAGVTTATGQVNVDNLRLDGNTLSATTGDLLLGVGASDSVGLDFTGNQDYYFLADANNTNNLNIQGQSAGTNASVDFFSLDGTGVNNNIRIVGSGTPTDMATNFEALQMGWDGSKYRLFSGASGTGTVQDFAIDIGAVSNALHVDSASGWVSINGSAPSSELDVNGRFQVDSTTKPSRPMPLQTNSERDLTTPLEGDFVANTDTNRPNYYNGTSWKEVVTEQRDLDTFYVEDFEINDLSNWTTGNSATPFDSGTIAGATTISTASPIAGDNSYLYTQAGSGSASDWSAAPVITLERKQKGALVTLSGTYEYDGADDDITLYAYTDVSSTVPIAEAIN